MSHQPMDFRIPGAPKKRNPKGYCFDSIVGLGFIPYYGNFPNGAPQNSGFRKYFERNGKRARLGLKGLFFSGNKIAPIPAPLSRHDLNDILREKNYRGLLLVQRLTLFVSGNTPVFAIWSPLDQLARPVGYTLYRLPLLGFTLLRSRGRPATGHFNLEVQRLTAGGLTLDFSLTFRIGRVGNWFATVLTGYEAPWVSIKARYVLTGAGVAHVRFGGTIFPSQRYFTLPRSDKLKYVEHHHLEDVNSENEVGAALQAGDFVLPNYFKSPKPWTLEGRPFY